MRAKEFTLNEGTTKNRSFLSESISNTFKIEGSWTDRVFITMFEQDPETEWLMGPDPIEVGDATVDLNPANKSAYINRIDITRGKSSGKGTIFLSSILKLLVEYGFKEATAYIENNNSDSKGLFRKLGFVEYVPDEWDAQYGIYVRKDL